MKVITSKTENNVQHGYIFFVEKTRTESGNVAPAREGDKDVIIANFNFHNSEENASFI